MAVQDRSRRWALGCGGLLTALAGLWGSSGCDNGATAEEACREIETARCRVVVGCPNSPVQTEEDVEHCELHYRDQCLFGMADSLNPDQPAVTGCVNAINQARGCWDAGQTMGECNTAAEEAGVTGPALVTGYGPDLTGCDAIMFPEILVACSFLLPEQPETEEAAGGSGG